MRLKGFITYNESKDILISCCERLRILIIIILIYPLGGTAETTALRKQRILEINP